MLCRSQRSKALLKYRCVSLLRAHRRQRSARGVHVDHGGGHTARRSLSDRISYEPKGSTNERPKLSHRWEPFPPPGQHRYEKNKSAKHQERTPLALCKPRTPRELARLREDFGEYTRKLNPVRLSSTSGRSRAHAPATNATPTVANARLQRRKLKRGTGFAKARNAQSCGSEDFADSLRAQPVDARADGVPAFHRH